MFIIDWKRASRWCCLGTIVMLVWLLAPVARCSFASFRDTPLSDADSATARPADADKDRVKGGQSFLFTMIHDTQSCYRRTPLFGQQPWKGNLLVAFSAGMILTWSIGRLTGRRRRKLE